MALPVTPLRTPVETTPFNRYSPLEDFILFYFFSCPSLASLPIFSAGIVVRGYKDYGSSAYFVAIASYLSAFCVIPTRYPPHLLRAVLQTVYEVIRASLEAEARNESATSGFCHNFELFLAGPTRVLERDNTSLREANILAPACVVHLRWDDEHAGVECWGPKLEDAMRIASGDARYPRVPYSSR